MPFAVINTTSAGPVILVTGVAGKKINIISFYVTADLETKFQLLDGAASMTGPTPLRDYGMFSSSDARDTSKVDGLFASLGVGNDLKISQTAPGPQLSGRVEYVFSS